jgi:hypothetical protein
MRQTIQPVWRTGAHPNSLPTSATQTEHFILALLAFDSRASQHSGQGNRAELHRTVILPYTQYASCTLCFLNGYSVPENLAS